MVGVFNMWYNILQMFQRDCKKNQWTYEVWFTQYKIMAASIPDLQVVLAVSKGTRVERF